MSKKKRSSDSESDSSSSKDQKRSSKSSNSSVDKKLLNKSQLKPVEESLPVVDIKTLDEINTDTFNPKPFNSSAKKVNHNIVIDLKKQIIKVPEVQDTVGNEPASIFHHSLFQNEEVRIEKWVKELYSYRQKALQQGISSRK